MVGKALKKGKKALKKGKKSIVKQFMEGKMIQTDHSEHGFPSSLEGNKCAELLV